MVWFWSSLPIDGGPWKSVLRKEKALLSEDASQDAAEAAHVIVAAFRLCRAAQDHTQHASQSGGVDAVAFLAFAQ